MVLRPWLTAAFLEAHGLSAFSSLTAFQCGLVVWESIDLASEPLPDIPKALQPQMTSEASLPSAVLAFRAWRLCCEWFPAPSTEHLDNQALHGDLHGPADYFSLAVPCLHDHVASALRLMSWPVDNGTLHGAVQLAAADAVLAFRRGVAQQLQANKAVDLAALQAEAVAMQLIAEEAQLARQAGKGPQKAGKGSEKAGKGSKKDGKQGSGNKPAKARFIPERLQGSQQQQRQAKGSDSHSASRIVEDMQQAVVKLCSQAAQSRPADDAQPCFQAGSSRQSTADATSQADVPAEADSAGIAPHGDPAHCVPCDMTPLSRQAQEQDTPAKTDANGNRCPVQSSWPDFESVGKPAAPTPPMTDPVLLDCNNEEMSSGAQAGLAMAAQGPNHSRTPAHSSPAGKFERSTQSHDSQQQQEHGSYDSILPKRRQFTADQQALADVTASSLNTPGAHVRSCETAAAGQQALTGVTADCLNTSGAQGSSCQPAADQQALVDATASSLKTSGAWSRSRQTAADLDWETQQLEAILQDAFAAGNCKALEVASQQAVKWLGKAGESSLKAAQVCTLPCQQGNPFLRFSSAWPSRFTSMTHPCNQDE